MMMMMMLMMLNDDHDNAYVLLEMSWTMHTRDKTYYTLMCTSNTNHDLEWFEQNEAMLAAGIMRDSMIQTYHCSHRVYEPRGTAPLKIWTYPRHKATKVSRSSTEMNHEQANPI